jgi:hypothetical protein
MPSSVVGSFPRRRGKDGMGAMPAYGGTRIRKANPLNCGLNDINISLKFNMTTKTKFKTDAFAALHASASALNKINAISKSAMRDFDTACLVVPAEIKPHQIIGVTDGSR